MSDVPLIYLIAGEPSGDLLGGRLMRALVALTGGEVRFAGIGGPAMADAGLASLFPIDELTVMGLFEVAPRIPRLLRRMRETADAIRARRPAAVVTIDAPSFCAGVWRRLGPTEAKLIHYVAPSVWAWRPGRAAKLARRIDHLMTLLPFEPPYFERVGLPATFVGHPVVESGAAEGKGPAFRQRHGIAPEAPLVCVLPGSRPGEVRRLVRPFGDAVARLAERRRGLTVAVPTVSTVAAPVADEVSAWPIRTILLQDERDKFDAMAASDVALAASGTVTLELALAGTPMVVAYRMNPITHRLVRAMVRIEHAALVNILAGHEAVPELIQGKATPTRLAAALERLIGDPAARAAQRETFERIAERLRADEAPSFCAARVVLETIGQGAMMAQATNRQGDR